MERNSILESIYGDFGLSEKSYFPPKTEEHFVNLDPSKALLGLVFLRKGRQKQRCSCSKLAYFGDERGRLLD